MRQVLMRWVAAVAVVVGLGAASVGTAAAATPHAQQQVQRVHQTQSGQMHTADWWW